MGSIREVAISRSVSSRTMSAADRQRSWRSANESSCRDHGRRSGPSGGPKARKKDAGLARKMQIRSKVGSRDREVISSQSRRNGPQSRANTHQTDLVGGEWDAKAKTHQTNLIGGEEWGAEAPTHHAARPAVKHGILAGGNHRQCQVHTCGPQSRLRIRVRVCSHGGVQNPMN